MRRYLAPFLALLLFAAAASSAEDKITESEYFPLKVGTRWEYKSPNGKFTVRVAKHEKVGDALCALLETVREGKVIGSQHVAAKADGLYRYTDQGKQAQPPLLFLKLPPKKGETWKFDFKLAGQQVKGTFTEDQEEVTVPAGKYKAVVVETKDAEGPATLKTQAKWWYAPGVGLVKQQTKVGDAEATFELEKFEPGK